jgi:hypothetical protein
MTTPIRNKLVIEGDIVSFVEERDKGSVEIESFINALRQGEGVVSGFLPNNTIYFIREKVVNQERIDAQRKLFVIEQPCRKTSVAWNNPSTGEKEYYKVALPFVLFFIVTSGEVINDIYPCCSKKKIVSLDDPIFVLPLPNIYEGGHGKLCTGEVRIPRNQPLHIKINALVNAYYTSNFNNDLETYYPDAMADEHGNPGLPGWAKKSEANALFGVSDEVQYAEHRAGTFQGMINTTGFSSEH